jgi:hypothetical protein
MVNKNFKNKLMNINNFSEKITTRSARMKNITNSLDMNIKNSFSVNSSNSLGLESKAARNGTDFVYHRSNCGYPAVRMYCCGGDGRGSACGYWASTTPIACGLSHADMVWYGYSKDTWVYDKIETIINNKANGTVGEDHNFSTYDFIDITYKCG